MLSPHTALYFITHFADSLPNSQHRAVAHALFVPSCVQPHRSCVRVTVPEPSVPHTTSMWTLLCVCHMGLKHSEKAIAWEHNAFYVYGLPSSLTWHLNVHSFASKCLYALCVHCSLWVSVSLDNSESAKPQVSTWEHYSVMGAFADVCKYACHIWHYCGALCIHVCVRPVNTYKPWVYACGSALHLDQQSV